MGQTVSDHLKVTPFFVFFLIHGMQVGTGLLGFQRVIAEYAGYDSWISIIIAGITVHLIIFAIYKILETVDGDIDDVHKYVFGNFFSKIFNIIFIVYFIIATIMTFQGYFEIVKVWVFPGLRTTALLIPFLLISYYIVNGGFRVVTGMVVFGVFIPIFIYFTILSPAKFGQLQNLLPIFNHSLKEIILSSYRMTLSFLGYEMLLIYYPFIKNKANSKKWAYLGVFVTATLYIYFSITTFAFFSRKHLEIAIWPTLTMWKVVQFPLIERFEYVGIATWLFMIIPNICILLWATNRLIKKTFKTKEKSGLFFALLVCLVVTPMIETTSLVELFKNIVAHYGIVLTYIYIPILLLLVLIAKRVRER